MRRAGKGGEASRPSEKRATRGGLGSLRARVWLLQARHPARRAFRRRRSHSRAWCACVRAARAQTRSAARGPKCCASTERAAGSQRAIGRVLRRRAAARCHPRPAH
eukprot:1877754-Prymnesium_polylepis.2